MKPRPGLDDDLYPFAGHFHVQADGHRMHYLDEGPADARPVVMVHGNPTWSFYYRNVVRALRGTRRCLVPDHVGCGRSDRPGDAEYRHTLQSRMDDLGGWLDAVAPGGALDLVVHDWGGAIGLGWAVRHPERVRRLVVLNTAAFTMPASKRLPGLLKIARTRPGAFVIQRFNAFSALGARVATAKRLDPAVRRGLTAPYRGGPERRLATLRFVQDIPLEPSDPSWAPLAETERLLPRLAGRSILFGWGMKDFVFDRRILDHWRGIWPEARFATFDDAGHYVLEDVPERLVPMIAEHLADAG